MAEEGFLHGLGPWPSIDIETGLLVFFPHNSPLKSCCSAPRTDRRVLATLGLCHDFPSRAFH